ncbi:MAG TPA: hypothetical protein VMW72_21020 [Sedimentisphaerales bacterium]|nr:hypothetical protein [Sedimentisphaerales bacterium]
MELSGLMKLRIAAAIVTGVVLIGILAWPLATPSGPLSTVRAGDISLGGAIILVILAFLAGFIAYFVSWPYGREIGILAAPSGLAILAVRSGSMAALVQLNPAAEQRQALLATFKWDSIFWLVIVAAGFAGVLLGQKILSSPRPAEKQKQSNSKPVQYLNAIIALVGSALIAHFGIKIFAQDVEVFDNSLGSLMAQPSVGQIVFAVFVSFGLAAFVVKKFLDVSYIWPAIACALVTAFAASTYANQEVLQYLVQRWPPTFFSNSVVSVLPLQMVAFGTLGSIAGYWMGVRYSYCRKHESK